VPDLRVEVLAERFGELLSDDLPLADEERLLLRGFAPTFAQWCEELSQYSIPATVQHDDLHHNNLYLQDGRVRILDWGDTSISHPFASLVVTFQFLEQVNRLHRTDAWFARLRDAYLEPWGRGYVDTFSLALDVGTFAHAIAWVRQRSALPASWLPEFDKAYRPVLDRVLELALMDK
jgi:aminoglycoside phosphotransferase (APT) family kinase protein